MCVGMPAVVLRVAGPSAYVSTGDGRVRKAMVAAPEKLHKGDCVLLYADTIVNRMERSAALQTIEDMKQMAMRAAEEDGKSTEVLSRAYEERLAFFSSGASSCEPF